MRILLMCGTPEITLLKKVSLIISNVMDKVYEKKLEILSNLLETISQVKKQKSEFDLAFFIDNFIPHLAPVTRPPFHKEIISILQGGNITRQLFQAPRGFAKSSIVSRFFPLWLAVYGKKKDIFLVSATISLAKENLRFLRQELETNEELIRAFGELKSDKWTEEQLNLSNGVIIRAKGRGFQIRGFRPDVIVCDDLEDEEVMYSKEQRDKMEEWFFRTLLPSLKPDQALLYVGTMLHPASLMAKLRDKEEFQVRSYKAITEGRSIWEELWPTALLLKLQKEIGTYAFEAEYQNNPLSRESQPIHPEYLESVKIGGEVEHSVLAFDPAISEKDSADNRAIVLMGRTTEGFRELHSEKGKWGIDEQVDRIIALYEDMKPERILIEEVAYQKVFRTILTSKAREKKLFLPISTASLSGSYNPNSTDKRPKDKYTRLLSVVHLFEQKKVEVKNPDLVSELLSFPYGDHDDMVDACVYALQWLMSYRTGLAQPKKQMENVVNAKKSFYIEEVRSGVFVTKAGDPPIITRTKRTFISYGRG